MSRWMAVVVVAAALPLVSATCVGERVEGVGAAAAGAGEVVQKIAPVLPGPWGGIAAVGGTLLTILGSIFAKRQVNAAFTTGGAAAVAAVNPISKVLSQRKWLWPTIGALVAAGNAAGLWHIEGDKLAILEAALIAPAAGEAIKDAAEAKKG